MARSIIVLSVVLAISLAVQVSGLLVDYEYQEDEMQPVPGSITVEDHDYEYDGDGDENRDEDKEKQKSDSTKEARFGDDGSDDGVELQIFYEAGCPESKRFFGEELPRTIELMGKHFYVELVPFGFANITEDGLKCDHGPQECEGNRRHACIIERTKTHMHQLNQIKTIHCLMMYTKKETCYQRHLPEEIKTDEIEKCVTSDESMELMKKYKAMTPKQMNHLPYLAIEGKYHRGQYEDCKGSSGLRECICEQILVAAKPRMCKQHFLSR